MAQVQTESQVVEPRPPVPSARQLSLGPVRLPGWDAGPDAQEQVESKAAGAASAEAGEEGSEQQPELPRLSFGQQVRLALAEQNPARVVQGYPLLPLLVFATVGFVTNLQNQALILLFPNSREIMGGTNLAVLSILPLVANGSLNLAGPGLGYLADRHRVRVWFLRGGTIVQNLSAIGTGLATAPLAFIGMVAGRGVGGVLQNPAQTIPADYYPIDVRLKVGLYNQKLAQLAILVGAPLAGFITINVGWRWTLLLFGILGLVFTVPTFLLKEPVQGAADRVAAGADPDAVLREQQRPGFAQTLREVFAIRSVRLVYMALPFLFATTAVTIIQQIFFSDYYRLGPQARSFIVAGGGGFGLLGTIVFTPIFVKLSSYRPGRLLNLAGVLLAVEGVVLLVMGSVTYLPVAVVCSMLFAMLIPVILGACITILQVVVPARVRTTATEMIGVFGLLGGLYPPIAGQVGVLLAHFMPFLDPRAVLVSTFAPPAFLAAYFISRAGLQVQSDIRNAIAVAMADEEVRSSRSEGRNKMVICRDVDVTYESNPVLFHVNLDIEEGEIVALLGTNGAGKSTLLRAISGIQPASNGAIFLDGADITHSPPHLNAANGVVMMPGGHAVFPSLTVEENLTSAAWLYRRDKEYVKARVEQVLTWFPVLRERFQQVAGTMSGGEQQQLALSQAFLMKPRLLMIDELSLGLAPQVVELLLNIVREINAQGTTVMLVEQSVNVALALAERAVFMEKGEVRFDGKTKDLMEHREILRSVFLGEARRTGNLTSGGRARDLVAEASADAEEVLAVEDLKVHFGGVAALGGVNLRVAAGEVVGLVGANGAGKTTLFDAISGYVRADEGRILLTGNDVTKRSPDLRARLGLSRSFQNVRLFPALTVRENVIVALERNLESKNVIAAALWLPNHRSAERRARRRMESLIESLGLEAFADKFINELSTGTRRIVDIACILASTPRVLLLDEPSSGLAQAETEELGPFIARISKETGCAVLVIEHDISLVASVSDRMVAMRLGQVMMEGTPQEVLNDAAVSAALIGEAEVAMARSGALRTQPEPALTAH